MGCDIHLYTEVKKGRQWISADKWGSSADGHIDNIPIYEDRNYWLFGMLAGVRYTEFAPLIKPRGLPNDLSIEVRAAANQWGVDGHTHHWYSLDELDLSRCKVPKTREKLIYKILMERHQIVTTRELKVQLSLGAISREPLDTLVLCAKTWIYKGSPNLGYTTFVNPIMKFLHNKIQEHSANDARIVFWFDN